jgi:hypothetical protein
MTLRVKQGLVIALGIAVAAAMVVMGYWQLGVYHNQGRAAAERRASAPPVSLSSVARARAAVMDGYGRSVTFEGTYDPALQLLVPVGQTGQFGTQRAAASRREPGGGGTRCRLRNGKRTATAERSRSPGRRTAAQRGTCSGG